MKNINYDRIFLADLIHKNLTLNKEALKKNWQITSSNIAYFYIDDLLPENIVLEIFDAFPKDTSKMYLRKTLRELKLVTAQMNKYSSLLEEIIFAFQDEKVVNIIHEITGLRELLPDSHLYAGGISMMAENHFLNPHLDNSHDKERKLYRVANLLYYVTPKWYLENGGNLELWPNGTKSKQITVESKFNRLVVMITNDKSWHSVSPVRIDKIRCCISNYYFSKCPANDKDYYHVTSFRGRPEEYFRDWLLRCDSIIRSSIRKIFPHGIVKTKHYYNKDNK